MADGYTYRFLVTAPGGGESRDTTQLVQSISWTGDVRQTARELTAALIVPRDGSVETPPLEEGAWLTMQPEPVLRSAAPVFHQHPVCGGQCVCPGPGAVSGG